ncbi:uncharacterized protein LOC110716587 [Chenopodium quinoa]|uniref:Bifunctional lysine-specific demethylase and histidyl-hydroxylase n=1 Tax=Chenopodium quinoa TaxID=63459 RepID=A0A803MKG9_CHEQI|nr:uncharacterized protein LOC110716587 [Chenopodium quinoa]
MEPKQTTIPKARKKQPWQNNPNIITLFSITLASLKTPLNPLSKPLILNSSNKLLRFLHPNSPFTSNSPLLNPILSLLPLMLHSSDEEIIRTAVKIVGAVSLVSIEANERVAGDSGIVKGLVLNILRFEMMETKKLVCNAILDLSITSLGCQRLLDVSGLNYIMLGFLQVQKSLVSSLYINLVENEGNFFLGVKHKQEKIPLLLLNAAATLINFCHPEQLKSIPRKLKEATFPYLGEIWSKVRAKLLASEILNVSKVKCCYKSNLTAKSLAESIFRLSMDALSVINSMPSEVVMGHIFGPSSTSFTNFMLEHWESSPFLIRNQPKYPEAPHAIFSSFMHSLTSEEELPKCLSSILRGMVSCPPVALNEIDCLSLLNDVRDTLGSPIIYQQDIRVVKTSMHSKLEEHYFQEYLRNGIEGPRAFSAEDILKCEGAYRKGYTTAVRGMEFRNSDIAAVTREIASMFGQPSVGANLYVTPPNSQGLSCHYDDHCVFVCQLYGVKQWTVYPKPIIELPRLYECLEVPQELLVQSRQILLDEGDVLYLPRGFAHEACTVADLGESSKVYESSVHLTLAIEVEPPFEWEGFAHIALYLWSRKTGSDTFAHDTSGMLSISVYILHIAMRLLSSTEPIFRKACLAAASSLPIDTIEWHEKNQRATFKLASDKINELCSFTDSLEYLQKAVERDDDPFHWLRWLELLNGRDVYVQNFCNFNSDRVCNILSFINQHKDDAEAAFAHVKSNFCSEDLFDDAKESFKTLHALYKEARMRYMNGMLSLHH